MGIGETLRKLRKEKKLTQLQLSKETGISVHSINSYESGRREPNSKAMAALEQYFNVSGGYLRGDTDELTLQENRKATLEEIESGIMEVWESAGLFDPNIELSEKKRELIIKMTKTILESDM